MNPKEVSYSHPQLPLCDTPKFVMARPIAHTCLPSFVSHLVMVVFRKEAQNYGFSFTRQEV